MFPMCWKCCNKIMKQHWVNGTLTLSFIGCKGNYNIRSLDDAGTMCPIIPKDKLEPIPGLSPK